jgi:hypothetical protein
MEVLQDKTGTTLRFERKLSKKEINNIQSYLNYAKAVKGSKAKSTDIEEFAEMAKQETWNALKKKV